MLGIVGLIDETELDLVLRRAARAGVLVEYVMMIHPRGLGAGRSVLAVLELWQEWRAADEQVEEVEEKPTLLAERAEHRGCRLA